MSADRQLTLKPVALARMTWSPGSLSDRFAKDVGRARSYFLEGRRPAPGPLDSVGADVLAALAATLWLGVNANITSLGGIAIAIGAMIEATTPDN